jgi:hypothetical protein
MTAHALARHVERAPVGAPRLQRLAADVGHPQFRRPRRLVEQPHAAGVRFRFLDQLLDEHAEEAAQVRMGDEQVERELHRIPLDRRHALGAHPIVAQRAQLGLEAGDLVFGRDLGRRGALFRLGEDGHAPIISHTGPQDHLRRGTMPASSFWPIPA